MFYFIVFWKIVKKFDEDNAIISHFKKLGLNNDINLSSSIIYQFPSLDTKKFKTYEFPIIEESYLQKKSISKYEIPQYIQDIPDGFSVFCTLGEASKVKQYIRLNNEEQNQLNLKESINIEKNNIDFNEPVPKTNFCYLCQRTFDDYLIHIETLIHKNSLHKNQILIKSVQNSFKRINQFWFKEKSKETIQKKVSSHNRNFPSSSSLSSFPSLNSANKSDNNSNYGKNNIFVINMDSPYNENTINEIDNKNIKKDIKINKNEDYENKDNNISYSIIDSTDKNSLILLKKKRKANIHIEKINDFILNNNNDEDSVKHKDYFLDLNINKTKKLIRNMNVFFK